MRNRIITAAIEEINETSLKFTMADLAARLAISKSTLYVHFKSKEELITALVDLVIEDIRQQNEEILHNDMTDIFEKLQAVVATFPRIISVNNNFLFALKRQFPKAWEKIQQIREYKLKIIESLLIRGIEAGDFRPVDPAIVKMIITATSNEFFNQNFLMRNNLTFKEGGQKMADILYFGITNHK